MDNLLGVKQTPKAFSTLQAKFVIYMKPPSKTIEGTPSFSETTPLMQTVLILEGDEPSLHGRTILLKDTPSVGALTIHFP